jgi:hypothetical protein
MVEVSALHCSPCAPSQVPSRERHTFPSLYRFGLKRTVPLPVVRKVTYVEGESGNQPE